MKFDLHKKPSTMKQMLLAVLLLVPAIFSADIVIARSSEISTKPAGK